MSRRSVASPPRRPTRTALRRELRNLARELADRVVDLLDDHGVWEEPTLPVESEAARRVRRSADALRTIADRILVDLRARKQPAAISSIADSLGVDRRSLAHPMHLLVSEGKVVQHGSRRGARYELARRPRARIRKAARKRSTKKRRRR